MPAKRIKTLFNNPNERKHRSHRSNKRHRGPSIAWGNIKAYKEKKQALKIKELSTGFFL